MIATTSVWIILSFPLYVRYYRFYCMRDIIITTVCEIFFLWIYKFMAHQNHNFIIFTDSFSISVYLYLQVLYSLKDAELLLRGDDLYEKATNDSEDRGYCKKIVFDLGSFSLSKGHTYSSTRSHSPGARNSRPPFLLYR